MGRCGRDRAGKSKCVDGWGRFRNYIHGKIRSKRLIPYLYLTGYPILVID